MIKPVVAYPNSALRGQMCIVPAVHGEMCMIAQDLVDTMQAAQFLGISAPQIMQPYRIIAVCQRLAAEVGYSEPLVLFNPQIVEKSNAEHRLIEGCLSFPGITAYIDRARQVKVSGIDWNGKPVELEARDVLAQVLQHEIDHLTGVLLLDRCGMVKRNMIKARLQEKYRGRFLDYSRWAPAQEQGAAGLPTAKDAL